jgi:hypothetical protein
MLKPEVQQALFDKYAPDPKGAEWDVVRFAKRISTEPAPRGDWLRKYLHIVCEDTVKTRFNDPDVIKESIVANQCFLFCGELIAMCPAQLKGVAWHDVTDEMVDKLLQQLSDSFSLYEAGKALHLLSAFKYSDESLDRQKAVTECMEKLLPDSVEAYTEGPVINLPIQERLMSMKYKMLEYIANL